MMEKQKLFPFQGRKLRLLKIRYADLQVFFQKVEKGVPYETAANLLGLSKATIYEWLRKGEKYTEQPKHLRNPKHRICAEFSYHLKGARARFLAQLIDSINNSSLENERWERDWKVLQARDSKNWGPGAWARFTKRSTSF